VNRAVFIDRDGTLVPDIPYLDDAEKLRLFPGAADSVARLREAGFLVIVVTNQSGIGRGFFSEETLGRIHEKLAALLGEEGTSLDGLYYCPHRPDEGCSCRKPETGLIDRAVKDLNVSLEGSYVVGDDVADIDLARNAGTKSVLVLTGHGIGSRSLVKPNVITSDISEGVDWILKDSGSDA
jgi:histidinol-phosphate phosphatase family protein